VLRNREVANLKQAARVTAKVGARRFENEAPGKPHLPLSRRSPPRIRRPRVIYFHCGGA